MKKLKYLFVLLLAILAIPFMTFADEEVEEEKPAEDIEVTASVESEKEEVPIYFFRGEGCPHCEEAEEWFKSIEEEHGSKFKVVDYETWYNEENADLMQKVANSKNEEANGVPYIIIGSHSWNGFTDDYKEEMLAEINSQYEKPVSERDDALASIGKNSKKKEKKEDSNDVVALLVILLVTGGACFGIYKARNNTN